MVQDFHHVKCLNHCMQESRVEEGGGVIDNVPVLRLWFLDLFRRVAE
jgi:hypothetical protein